MVYTAALTAGVTREPMVSVPKAIGARPALTAMHDPDEEPRGFCFVFSDIGFSDRVWIDTLWPPILSLQSKPPRTYADWAWPAAADHPQRMFVPLELLAPIWVCYHDKIEYTCDSPIPA